MYKRLLFLSLCCLHIVIANSQNVGIGITQPKAGLHIVNDNGLLATGTVGAGADLTEVGAGAKLIWHPKKSAFRVGSADNTSWNDSLIGFYSLAMGRFSVARGISSVSIGEANVAYNGYSIGIGQFNNLRADFAFGLGINNKIDLPHSFAIGNNANIKSGGVGSTVGYNFMIGNDFDILADSSFGFGNNIHMAGSFFPGLGVTKSFVIGNGSQATNDFVFVLGNGGIGNGDSSYAIGNYTFTGNLGSFAIGNGSSARGIKSFSIGNQTNVSGLGTNGFAIGNRASCSGINAISIGNAVFVNNGYDPHEASGSNSITIGNGCNATVQNALAIGRYSEAMGVSSIAIGNFAQTSGNSAIAIGSSPVATGSDALAIGSSCFSTAPNSIAIGNGLTANGQFSTSMGVYANNGNHRNCFVINGSSNGSLVNQTANTQDFQMMMNFDDYIFWCNTPGKIVRFSSNGDICASGAVTANSVSCFSDIRLKKNINPLQNSLQQISRLSGYHYQWIDSTQTQSLQTGLIAQEVKAVFPELVSENADGVLSVNYIGLVPHLLESVKTLKSENEAMKKEIEEIKKMLLNKPKA